jgi:TRAP transporter 4TM/12TM fusion protein
MFKLLYSFLLKGGEREITGIFRKVVSGFAVIIALYHLYTFTVGTYTPYPHRVIHAGTILAFCFLTYSFSASRKKAGRWPIVDSLLGLLSLSIMTYLLVNHERLIFDRISLDPTTLSRLEVFMGIAFILLVLEAARRAMGPVLPLMAMAFLIYARVGPYLGGLWWHQGFSVTQIVDFTVFSMEGMFGTPLGICSTYIILFMTFGAIIMVSGAGEFYAYLANAIAGRSSGGPAKVAVIGSGTMASISGSAVANIAITGSVTIPMMKRVGFPSYFAGAVEAAASDGGHIMPPVMGGVAFIMSGFTGIPYGTICLASAIPAILYFAGVGLQVHFFSKKRGIPGMLETDGEIPSVWDVLKKGWQFFLPIIAISVLLIYGYSPIRAALYSMPVALLASWFRKETRIGIREILGALGSSIKMTRVVMLATASSGIIMAGLFYSGLGHELVAGVGEFSKGTLMIPLLLAAITCFVIGMGASLVAAYILTAILIVPTTVKLGVSPLAAHLFAIYFASIATISPPVGAAFYQAAAMANAPPFKTGLTAVRLAFAGFIVPFFFIYNSALLLVGSLIEIIAAAILSLIGVTSLAAAAEGWVIGKLSTPERVALGLGGFFIMFPSPAIRIPALTLIIFIMGRKYIQLRHPAKCRTV